MDRFLVDTNVLVNIIEKSSLNRNVKHILEDSSNKIYTCSECVKEFINLIQTGKVGGRKNRQKVDAFDFIENELGYTIKYISKEHLKTLAKLEIVDEHKDPCDRLIVAHAITEKIPIISSDTKFPNYIKYGLELIPNR